jgi:putative transposase
MTEIDLDPCLESTIAFSNRVHETSGRRTLAMAHSRGGRRNRRPGQLTLPLARDGTRRGGVRAGAGRKRESQRVSVPHRARAAHRRAHPVHVTLRAGLASLRSQFLFPTVRIALSEATRRDPAHFRVVHFSVQRDHVHLIVEAANERELSRGMRSVAIRIALAVNRLLMRRGRLWADRFHARELVTPREVRNGLVYVLANFRKHARGPVAPGLDPCSSAAWFDGWREWSSGSAPFAARPPPGVAAEPLSEIAADPARDSPVAAPRTWLLAKGFRRHGLLGIGEAPRVDHTRGDERFD